jgi:lysophospholipase L1-like esterase
VASGFDAFRPVAEKSGGNSTTAGLVLPHDVHPTAEGQRLLAEAVEKALR